MIDLRSDTVTRPTPAMRAAMAAAEVGDDVYGDDPTITALEERVADMFGHEAALFTVTGSLANILGVRAHMGPGREMACEAQAHVVRAELGAHAMLTGMTTRTWSHRLGFAEVDQVMGLIAPDIRPFLVSTAVVEIETTHNFAGGTVQPVDSLQATSAAVRAAGVAVHVDGARIWHAMTETGADARTYGALATTMSVCFSKGLGAPVGSAVLGSREMIAEARDWRKRLGAGWRQAGILAAAADHALTHHLDGLADDHAHARALAGVLADLDVTIVDPTDVHSNIVVLDLRRWATTARPAPATALAAALAAEGILVSTIAPALARVVTHRDVSAADCRVAADRIAATLRGWTRA